MGASFEGKDTHINLTAINSNQSNNLKLTLIYAIMK